MFFMTMRYCRVLHCQASVWNMFWTCPFVHLRLPILAAPTVQSYGSLWFSAASWSLTWSPLWLWCCKPALTSWAEWSGRIRFHRSTGLSPRHWESVTSQPWDFVESELSAASWKEPSQSMALAHLQEDNLVLILGDARNFLQTHKEILVLGYGS